MQSTGIKHKMNWRAYLRRYWVLYLFVVPALLDVLIFRYVPMYGVQIAFRNYKVRAASGAASGWASNTSSISSTPQCLVS